MKKTQVVYIAGPMRGLEDFGRQRFNEVAGRLEAMGHTIINPATLPTTLRPNSYMPICTAMIDAADCIYMLDGWEHSEGAIAELRYATVQNKQILYEK